MRKTILNRGVSWVLARGMLDFLPDKQYLQLAYWARIGNILHLKDPKTFNEKMQWLKLYDRKPEYTTMVDKYEAKKYVAERIGEQYIIPTLGVWDKFDDIDFNALPNQFVLKCTHDSGGLVIVKDRNSFDVDAAREKITRSLHTNYYLHGREWPYKNVHPRIIAEKYMENAATHDLRDYKFFIFDGIAKALFIATDRYTEGEETKFDFYDMDFRHLPFTNGHPNANVPIAKPERFEEMRRLAELLAEKIPCLRVDFYEVNGEVYFGECTFSHYSGLVPFEPPEWDEKFGSWIKLPEAGGYILTGSGFVLWLHLNSDQFIDLLSDHSGPPGNGLVEYKIFCFNGKAKIILVCKGQAHGSGRTNDYCDLNLIRYPFTSLNPNSDVDLERPEQMDQMIEIAEKLAEDIPQIRVDFYLCDRRIYVGELTFYHNSGFSAIVPYEWDIKLGGWIELTEWRR